MEVQNFDPAIENLCLTNYQKDEFIKNGYLILNEAIKPSFIELVQQELDLILKKEYPSQTAPDKPVSSPQNCHLYQKQVIHLINVYKCSPLISCLVMSVSLSKLICSLYDWPGCRIAEDQVWIKPPSSKGLTYHRDSTYFDFIPQEVITLWIALDNMEDSMGPLEYVQSSHQWQVNKDHGAAKVFYDNKDLKANVKANAISNGVNLQDIIYQKVNVKMGGVGIHDGRCFHGSGPNKSNRVRRAIGVHFIRSDAQFNPSVNLANIWQKFKMQGSLQLSQQFFPITYLKHSLQ